MRLPVTVLTGFLGAGKTTLLRRLIAERREGRLGLILNELGQGGTEASLGDVARLLELTDGCVCCARNPELLAALAELGAAGTDHVVVETTGVADPLAIAWTLARPEVAETVRLDGVVTVVDAANHVRARGPEWEAQIRAADLVLLSKLDLVDAAGAEAARAAVRAINPSARIAGVGDAPASALLGEETGSPRALAAARPHGVHSDFQVISLASQDRYRLEPLEDLLESLPVEVFRAKGVVRLADPPGGWAAFHVVGGRTEIDPAAAAPASPESRVVVFGRGLERAALAARFAEVSSGTPDSPSARRSSS